MHNVPQREHRPKLNMTQCDGVVHVIVACLQTCTGQVWEANAGSAPVHGIKHVLRQLFELSVKRADARINCPQPWVRVHHYLQRALPFQGFSCKNKLHWTRLCERTARTFALNVRESGLK